MKIIFTLLFCIPVLVFAQQNDFESWYNVKASGKLSKKITVKLGEEIKLFDNSTRISEHHTELGINYKIWKNKLVASGAYRFIKEQQFNTLYCNYHRITLNLRYRYKIDRFRFYYRVRYQLKYQNGYAQDHNLDNSIFIRNKIQVKYNIKGFKGSPFIHYENFHSITKTINQVDKYSIGAGCDYNISEKFDFSLEYMLRKQLNNDIPLNRYILSFSLSYNI